jgi:hypothetical protein
MDDIELNCQECGDLHSHWPNWIFRKLATHILMMGALQNAIIIVHLELLGPNNDIGWWRIQWWAILLWLKEHWLWRRMVGPSLDENWLTKLRLVIWACGMK